jgi:hypothetical protein
MTIALLATDSSGAPLAGLTPTWTTYVDAITGAPQAAPTISAVGLGSYKFDPTGTNPCGIIDFGGLAAPRYAMYATNPMSVVVFAAYDSFGVPLPGLVPGWHSLKKVSDNSNYAQPGISTLGNGLYKTTYIQEHVTGAVDLTAVAYPRYIHYDTEVLINLRTFRMRGVIRP